MILKSIYEERTIRSLPHNIRLCITKLLSEKQLIGILRKVDCLLCEQTDVNDIIHLYVVLESTWYSANFSLVVLRGLIISVDFISVIVNGEKSAP